MADDTTIKAVIANSSTWRTAANDLIDHMIDEGECFSSGEIARYIRIHRTDLKFSVARMGEHVRDLFYADAMPKYEDTTGNSWSAVQVPRVTSGVGRTPAGLQVFVYGPEITDADAHTFEVDIPLPPGVTAKPKTAPSTQNMAMGGYPTATAPAPTSKVPTQAAQPAATPNAQPAPKVVIHLEATVHTDRRLCVPRRAIEAYLHAAKKSVSPGALVYVDIQSDGVLVTLDTVPGATTYQLHAARGRVLFTSPGTPFVEGTKYDITVSQKGLTIDF